MFNFKLFSEELSKNFEEMSKNNLFTVTMDMDELWNLYLDTVSIFDNRKFITNRYHDCSCCRSVIKRIGNIININRNANKFTVKTIWDFETSDKDINMLLKTLNDYVLNTLKDTVSINVFLSKEESFGAKRSVIQHKITGETVRFDHLYIKLRDKFVFKPSYEYESINAYYAFINSQRLVFRRELNEFTIDAINDVMELINNGTLYRGNEHIDKIREFKLCKKEYELIESDFEKYLYTWYQCVNFVNERKNGVLNLRNSAIGTLIEDVSIGDDLEDSVKRYEKMVAPENYKRSKPIFTQAMLDNARKVITDLGYTDSLQRRYANIDDITVSNILFRNRDTEMRMEKSPIDDLFDDLGKEVKSNPKNFDHVERIPIDTFISDILPNVKDVEAYVENRHSKNFVSLIAPVNKDSKSMFKWNNNFSWAYTGNMTDSALKTNVKNAGGKVDGILRFSIQWNDIAPDLNDLDAHAIEPGNVHIFFNTYKAPNMTRTRGQLDVDVINPIPNVPAVENITWPSLELMNEGIYTFFVNCYTNRGGNTGFRAELEFDGEIYSFDYNKPMRQGENVGVAKILLKDGKFSVLEMSKHDVKSKDVWGVKTNDFTPVNVICYSPNYWDLQNGIGNKHYMFFLKDCINPELPNAWYNEFLNSELYPNHRKVMEAMSSKAHVQETNDQLSGIGFSSTQSNGLVVRVKDVAGETKYYNLIF